MLLFVAFFILVSAALMVTGCPDEPTPPYLTLKLQFYDEEVILVQSTRFFGGNNEVFSPIDQVKCWHQYITVPFDGISPAEHDSGCDGLYKYGRW